jgi:hypothetical protein
MARMRREPERSERALLAVLPRSVEVTFEPPGSAVNLLIGKQPLRVKWIGEGNLGDVRRLLEARVRPDVAVARRLSRGAREALSEAGIGWVDETGAAEIAIGSIVVARSGHRPVSVRKRPGWTRAVLAVCEALLCGAGATVSETQTATGLSAGSCTNALRLLTDLGILSASNRRGRWSGRRVTDPGRLLTEYASAAAAIPSSISLAVGIVWRDPLADLREVGEEWSAAGIEWASTGAVAAAVIAPYLTTVDPIEVYVEAETFVGLEAIAADSGFRRIDGGRLRLRPFPTVAVRRLAHDRDGLRVAPWPRVYADLRLHGVRGEEAAEHLREACHER